MRKFKKAYNLKIISLLVAGIFFVTNTGYSANPYAICLRKQLDFNKKEDSRYRCMTVTMSVLKKIFNVKDRLDAKEMLDVAEKEADLLLDRVEMRGISYKRDSDGIWIYHEPNELYKEGTYIKVYTKGKLAWQFVLKDEKDFKRPFSKKIDKLYFKPKSFEKPLYEHLGVKLLKKIMTYPIEKCINLLFAMFIFEDEFDKIAIRRSHPYFLPGNSISNLKKFEKRTTNFESYHIIAQILAIGILTSDMPLSIIKTLLYSMATVANFCGIILQRYNRSRIHVTIEEKKRRQFFPERVGGFSEFRRFTNELNDLHKKFGITGESL